MARVLQLRPHVKRSTFELYEAGEAIYEKYASRDPCTLELWQAVLLHSGVDVDRLGYDGFQALMGRNTYSLGRTFHAMMAPGKPLPEPTPEEQLCLNVEQALRAMHRGELEPHLKTRFLQSHTYTTTVEAEAFEAWAVKAGLPILGPWRELTDRDGRPTGAAVCFPDRTRGLEILSALAHQLHGKPWPGNDKVTTEGVALGFTEHVAGVAATILRPDEAKPGRPPGHSHS